ncbi:hypothetical protein DFH09DRAFT_1341810 [Mycena vulgaris]|nr:hypothetical protein DFH09DRAFT_1341810 [Mycena vulgaris]
MGPQNTRWTRAIQKQLATIRVSVPSLTAEMYSDLIELARPELYPEDILDAATDILFQQIDFGHTAPVVLTVSQLTLSEASQVTLRLFTSRDCGLSDAQFPVGVKSPRKVLDLLAMLLQLQPALAPACFAVLDQLTRNPSMCLYFLRLRNHPILRAHAKDRLHIPQICRTPLSDLQRRFSDDPRHRWNTWRLLERVGHSAEGRVLRLDTVLLHAVAEQSYATPEFFDAAVDLFDVLRCPTSGASRRTSSSPASPWHATHCIQAPISHSGASPSICGAMRLAAADAHGGASHALPPASRRLAEGIGGRSQTWQTLHVALGYRGAECSDSWEPLTVVLDFARGAGSTPALGEDLGFALADAKSKADPQLGAFLRYAEQWRSSVQLAREDVTAWDRLSLIDQSVDGDAPPPYS